MSGHQPFDPEKELPEEYRSGAMGRQRPQFVSWAPLILPLLIALFCTMYVVEYRASSQVPDGVDAVQARVTGSDRRYVDSDYTSLTFETEDGRTGRVTIDRGSPVPDEITVWKDGDSNWQTTAKWSTFRYYLAFLGYAVALALVGAFIWMRWRWHRRDQLAAR